MEKIVITILLIAIAGSIVAETIYLKDGTIYEDVEIVGVGGGKIYVSSRESSIVSSVQKSEVKKITRKYGRVVEEKTSYWLKRKDFMKPTDDSKEKLDENFEVFLAKQDIDIMSDKQFALFLQQQQNYNIKRVAGAVWGSCIVYIVYSEIRHLIERSYDN